MSVVVPTVAPAASPWRVWAISPRPATPAPNAWPGLRARGRFGAWPAAAWTTMDRRG